MYTYIPMEEENIRILGRAKAANPLPLFWTGSGVGLAVDGSELYFDFDTDYDIHDQWIRIEINGYPMLRTSLPKGRSTVCAFHGLIPEEIKTVKLIKEVQPMRIDRANSLELLAVRTDGRLYPMKEKSCKIEFIGDSITSGEGMAGTTDMHVWTSMIFSTLGHYAFEVGNALDAEVRILSQSGWGVCSSWDNDPKRAMPLYYEQVCGVLLGEKNERLGAYETYDFNSWKPDYIVVNLGSNDGYAFDNKAWVDENGVVYQQKRNADGSLEKESTDRFERAVYDFIVKLRKCNPDSRIIWAYGMLGRIMQPYIENAVSRYLADTGDKKVSFLLLPDLEDGWIGANNHPNALSHGAAAGTIIDAIKAF